MVPLYAARVQDLGLDGPAAAAPDQYRMQQQLARCPHP
jgi:hypothetical protein